MEGGFDLCLSGLCVHLAKQPSYSSQLFPELRGGGGSDPLNPSPRSATDVYNYPVHAVHVCSRVK